MKCARLGEARGHSVECSVATAHKHVTAIISRIESRCTLTTLLSLTFLDKQRFAKAVSNNFVHPIAFFFLTVDCRVLYSIVRLN
jgi:hypothetical protein